MDEKPDSLGELATEEPDVVSARATVWNGVERRKHKDFKRWNDTMSSEELDSRIAEMVNFVLIQNRAEELIGFSATSYSVAENQGSVTVTFTRQNPTTGLGIDFEVVTQPITAVPDLHYLAAVTGPITFLAGQTSIQRTITILNSNLGAGNSKAFRAMIAVGPRYAKGLISETVITITGVGVMSQNGVLQFSAPSVSIPENAGTTPGTVQVTRTGTLAPGAASVVVTSSPGSAVSPADFSAVNSTLNWTSGDAATKPVPFTVVNNAAAQGDKTCQLTLSAPTGAALGTVKTQTISILDLAPPAVLGAYPLRGGYHIGDPGDISSSAVLDKMMMEDVVIYGTRPNVSGGISGYQANIAALKARNPGIRVYLYWDPVLLKSSIGSFGDNLLAYMRAQNGVPGLGVAPNQWIYQDSSGNQPMNAAFGGCPSPYFENNAVPDSQGRRAWAYTLQYLKEHILDLVPAADGLFIDNFLHRPVDWTGSVVWQSNNANVSANDEPRRVSFRAGQLAGINYFKTLTAKRVLGNIGGWILSSTNVVPDMAALQLDGGIWENRFGTPLAPYGLDVQGASVLSNGNGNFATGKARSDHALYAAQNFRLRPPDIVFVCNGMTAANRAGAGRDAGYRFARYCLGTAWVCTDTYPHLHDKTTSVSYSASSDALAEYDEYWGADGAGLSVAQKFGFRKWMGLPLDPKQLSPAQSGCYRRRFENCLAWVNTQGNGTQNLTIEAAGAGKVWRRISGSQDPAVNTGAIVSGTYTLQDQDAIFLKRMDS